MNSLLWTSKSLRKIVAALKDKGHEVGVTTVRQELKKMGVLFANQS
jgi:hypothetical protein